jgi:hypothetical protein
VRSDCTTNKGYRCWCVSPKSAALDHKIVRTGTKDLIQYNFILPSRFTRNQCFHGRIQSSFGAVVAVDIGRRVARRAPCDPKLGVRVGYDD